MLETVIILLVILWAVGWFGPWHVALGPLVHLLLIIALIVLIFRILRGRSTIIMLALLPLLGSLEACGFTPTRTVAAVETTTHVKLAVNAHYDTDDWIYAEYSNFPSDPRAAVTISRRGWPHDHYVRIAFTDGDTAGELALGPLQSGEYIARAYSHVDADNVPHEAQAIAQTVPFVIFMETRNE